MLKKERSQFIPAADYLEIMVGFLIHNYFLFSPSFVQIGKIGGKQIRGEGTILLII